MYVFFTLRYKDINSVIKELIMTYCILYKKNKIPSLLLTTITIQDIIRLIQLFCFVIFESNDNKIEL